MTKRRTAIVLCIAAAGALAGAAAWYRLSRVTLESDPEAYWMREGARAYSRLPSAPARDVEAVRRGMEGATVEDAEGVLKENPSILGPLREAVVDFLTARSSVSSAAEYASWMRSHGYRFKAVPDFEKRYGPLKDQADMAGLDTRDIPTLFEAMWAYPPSHRATPDAFCTGPEAMTIALGHGNKNHFATQDPAGPLGYDLWHGGGGGTCRFWMCPPVTREELIALHKQVVCAQVGVIACVPGSDRRPLIVSLFLDPGSSKWWIDAIVVSNYTGTSYCGTATEY